jgi:hypothetical protein
MALDPESYYRHLGRLIEGMPDLSSGAPYSSEVHVWLGRADALISESGDLQNQVVWRAAVQRLNSAAYANSVETLKTVLYRSLAAAELRAPASAQGAFIPAGNAFDAFAAMSKVLQTATADVFVVDPYMDEAALTEFGGAVPNGITLRLLADTAHVKPTLEPAARRWISQYGATKPLSVRLAAPKTLHDRAILIDHKTAWTLTQSLNAFAKRSPAEIVRADHTAQLKIDAYETIWTAAQVIAST